MSLRFGPTPEEVVQLRSTPEGVQLRIAFNGNGAAGDQPVQTVEVVAGENLGIHRAVRLRNSTGTAVYADPRATPPGEKVFLTAHSALQGETVSLVLNGGVVADAAWSLMPGRKVFVSDNGTLTQTLPVVGVPNAWPFYRYYRLVNMTKVAGIASGVAGFELFSAAGQVNPILPSDMTSNTTSISHPQAVATGVANSPGTAYQAFDGDTGTFWGLATTPGAVLTLDLGDDEDAAALSGRITSRPESTRRMNGFTLEASTNGLSWDHLYSLTDTAFVTHEFEIPSQVSPGTIFTVGYAVSPTSIQVHNLQSLQLR